MKNIIALLGLFLVLASNSWAVTRDVQYNQEDQTNFGQLGVNGSSQPGNPGYISLIAPNNSNVLFTYYIWVDGNGKLRMASYPTISAFTSFPSGNWNTSSSTMGGTIVGTQS